MAKEKPTQEQKLWRKLELIDLRISVIEDRRNTLYAIREKAQAELLTERIKNERSS